MGEGLSRLPHSLLAQSCLTFSLLSAMPTGRDPFNLSNIVTGNVSNETFGEKKMGQAIWRLLKHLHCQFVEKEKSSRWQFGKKIDQAGNE